MIKKQTLGIASLLSAAFLYGFFGIFTRMIGFDVPLFYGSWTRSLLSFLVLLTPLLIFHSWKRIQRSDIKWFLLRSASGQVGFVGAYIAVLFISIGATLFIFYASVTIFSYVLGTLFFKEKLTTIKIISLVMAFLGLSFIYSVNIEAGKALYVFLALLSGLGVAVWNIFSKKISGSYSATQVNAVDFFFTFCIMLTLSLFAQEKWVAPALTIPWEMSLLLAGMFIGTGQLMVYGFKYLEVQIASLIMLSEIIFAIVLAYLFFKEPVSFNTFLGGLFIVFAIIFPEIPWKRLVSIGKQKD